MGRGDPVGQWCLNRSQMRWNLMAIMEREDCKAGFTRREFFLGAIVAASAAPVILLAADAPPCGLLDSFTWGDRQIPVSDSRLPANRAIDDAILAAMREYGVVGCGVSIVRGDALIYAKGFGFAELPHTSFLPTAATRCGSLAKPVTALAALQLRDQGKLDLDAEVVPILREVGIVPRPIRGHRVDERIAAIKVRHLMDHTSGLPNETTYTAWRPGVNVAARQRLEHVATGADVVADGLGNARLHAEPGAKFEYANANFVILARVIEARAKMPFNAFLTEVAMPRFGVGPREIYVSQNQLSPDSKQRGRNEPAYYQTSGDRFVSFVPTEEAHGTVYAEAYRGYATQASDGAGGIACAAPGLGKLLANLHSERPALSKDAIAEILTPPEHYTREPGFDRATSTFYSKGFNVRFSDGRAWFSHSGMTQHCGGVIGHNAGCQYVAVSNWNNAHSPYVDVILGRVLKAAVAKAPLD